MNFITEDDVLLQTRKNCLWVKTPALIRIMRLTEFRYSYQKTEISHAMSSLRRCSSK